MSRHDATFVDTGGAPVVPQVTTKLAWLQSSVVSVAFR